MISQPILATRAGRCPGCNAAIRVDELIVHDDVSDAWFHEECSPVEEKSDVEGQW